MTATPPAASLWPIERKALERLNASLGDDVLKLDDVVMVCAALGRLAAVVPPAASGDGLIARLRIIATDYKPGSILRNTLDEAIRRLSAVAPEDANGNR